MKRHPIYIFFEWLGRLIRYLTLGRNRFIHLHQEACNHFSLFFAVFMLVVFLISSIYSIGVHEAGILTWISTSVQLVGLKYIWVNYSYVIFNKDHLKNFLLCAALPVVVVFALLVFFLSEASNFQSVFFLEKEFANGFPPLGMKDWRSADFAVSEPMLAFSELIHRFNPETLLGLRLYGFFCLATTFLMLMSVLLHSSSLLVFSILVPILVLSVNQIWVQFLIATDFPLYFMILVAAGHHIFTNIDERVNGKSLFPSIVLLYSVNPTLPFFISLIGLFGGIVSERKKFLRTANSKHWSLLVVFGLTLYLARGLDWHLNGGGWPDFGLENLFDKVIHADLVLPYESAIFILGSIVFVMAFRKLAGMPVLNWLRNIAFLEIAFLLGVPSLAVPMALLLKGTTVETMQGLVVVGFVLGAIVIFLKPPVVKIGNIQMTTAGLVFFTCVFSGATGISQSISMSSVNQAMSHLKKNGQSGFFVYELHSVEKQKDLRPSFFGERYFANKPNSHVIYRSFRPFFSGDFRPPLLWPTSNALVGDIEYGHTPLNVAFIYTNIGQNKTSPSPRCEWFKEEDFSCIEIGDTTMISISLKQTKRSFLEASLNLYRSLFRRLKPLAGNRLHYEIFIFLNIIKGDLKAAEALILEYRKLVDPFEAQQFLDAVDTFQSVRSDPADSAGV